MAILAGSVACSAAEPVLSADPARAADDDITTIIVTTPRIQRSLYDTPAATSVIERDTIQRGHPGLKLDESLGGVPGVFLQNRENYAQGERLSIRGFGARAPFGVRGITVLVDGIPYTLPDGQAQLDAVDLDSAERIEVIRGPASVLYGNAAGGVVSITTADGRSQPEAVRASAAVGGDGLGKLALSQTGRSDTWSHSISLSALDQDGYRDQSAVQKYLLNAKARHELNDERALTFILNLLDNPLAEDPGALTAEQVKENRRQAGRFTEKFDTGQTVDQQVIGLQYDDRAAGPGELALRSFYIARNFEQQLPFPGDSLINYDRQYFGASAEYRQSLKLADLPFRYTAGLEARRQDDERQRLNVAFEGKVTGISARERQTADALAAFAQTDLELNDRLTLSTGARFDSISLAVDDDFQQDGDQSGKQTFDQWSGSAGLSYRFGLTHQAFANISSGFETPTFSEFANPAGGGFNPEVQPQKSLNHEIGMRGRLSYDVDYDLTLFWVDVRDELVPYELDENEGRTFYRNAGDTIRKGLELALNWRVSTAWRLQSALTLARYTFDEYQTGGQTLDGNRLPGLPERVWNSELQWSGLGERFAALELRNTGSLVADDANAVSVDEYWLVNIRAGDGWALGSSTTLKGYVAIHNVLDEDYFANVRINASGGRYFEPAAAGRILQAGVELAF